MRVPRDSALGNWVGGGVGAGGGSPVVKALFLDPKIKVSKARKGAVACHSKHGGTAPIHS